MGQEKKELLERKIGGKKKQNRRSPTYIKFSPKKGITTEIPIKLHKIQSTLCRENVESKLVINS